MSDYLTFIVSEIISFLSLIHNIDYLTFNISEIMSFVSLIYNIFQHEKYVIYSYNLQSYVSYEY